MSPELVDGGYDPEAALSVMQRTLAGIDSPVRVRIVRFRAGSGIGQR